MKKQCTICPHLCELDEGQRGICGVRANVDGEIKSLTYGQPCSIAIDPIEKKPLYHFLPGSNILSMATVGCNLHCKFCQNWEISQSVLDETPGYEAKPQRVVELAIEKGCRSIAYTYTEPTVFYEYALDCSIKAREVGLKNVLVTAAYINPEPWRRLCSVTDAVNIDLKAMSERFYRDICGAELKPVLDALVIARDAGVLVEVTNLVIPGLNDRDDDLRKLARWIKNNLGAEIPLHFSRFFPQYRMIDVEPTPKERLYAAREIAHSEGLNYVYLGNLEVEGGDNTICPECHAQLILRNGYLVRENNIQTGLCPQCGAQIYGVWN